MEEHRNSTPRVEGSSPSAITNEDIATLKVIMDPENGYENVTLLANGEWAATRKMAYTTGLFVGLNPISYRTRFCYEHEFDAVHALRNWDGNGFPPGFWVKQKPQEIHGPGSKAKVR